MFERIDTVIKKTLRKYGFEVIKDGEARYLFLKNSAKGTIDIKKMSEDFGEMTFAYKNMFADKKTDRAELIRNKGTNVLAGICGERFSLHFAEPKQFGVSAIWGISLQDAYASEVAAIITKCLSVAEACYTILDSDYYYQNDASRALLETGLKKTVNASGR